MNIIGVDIGGSHILSAVVDTETFSIIEQTRAQVDVEHTGTVDEIMTEWSKALNKTLRTSPSHIEGIGFAMPGPFDYRNGVGLFDGTNEKFCMLKNKKIDLELKGYLTDPNLEMRFLNDATSFAVGVSWFGEAKNCDRSIAITLGTGFGSAYIENGYPVVNRDDLAPQGCFWHLPFKEGIADDYFSTRWFVNEYEKLKGTSIAGVKEIAEEAANDKDVRSLFDQFGENLGQFFIPWLQKFPADMIVMGGNISAAYDRFGPAFESVLNRHGVETKPVVSALKEDAALIGSARLFDETFWDVIKHDLPAI
jgi:glucokinase